MSAHLQNVQQACAAHGGGTAQTHSVIPCAYSAISIQVLTIAMLKPVLKFLESFLSPWKNRVKSFLKEYWELWFVKGAESSSPVVLWLVWKPLFPMNSLSCLKPKAEDWPGQTHLTQPSQYRGSRPQWIAKLIPSPITFWISYLIRSLPETIIQVPHSSFQSPMQVGWAGGHSWKSLAILCLQRWRQYAGNRKWRGNCCA